MRQLLLRENAVMIKGLAEVSSAWICACTAGKCFVKAIGVEGSFSGDPGGRDIHTFFEVAPFSALQAAHAHFSQICEKTIIAHRVDGWGFLQPNLHVGFSVWGCLGFRRVWNCQGFGVQVCGLGSFVA